MKYVMLFEEFASFNEGVAVYPPGNPYEKEGSIQWPGLVDHMKKWMAEKQTFVLVVDFHSHPHVTYDKCNADPDYRSVPLGTWNDKELPLFTSENPEYKNTGKDGKEREDGGQGGEVDFDLLEIVPNEEKPREPWLLIVDKNGHKFMVPPWSVMDVQKGASVEYQLFSGSHYLIDKMRATITNIKDGKVIVKMQDGEVREYTPQEFKSHKFTDLEEKRNLLPRR